MSIRTSTLLLAATSAISLWDGANASAFLGTAPKDAPESVSELEVRTSLLEEMQVAVGHGATGGRMAEIEEAIRPMFNALPKDQYGDLDHATVRYALHRLFRHRHGWSIKGLEMGSDHRNVSSTAGILKDQVPGLLQDLFEKRMGGHGLGLRDVAILASTIEHLVHSEAKGKLETAFKALNMSLTSPISYNQSFEAIDLYMVAFINGRNLTSMSKREMTIIQQRIGKYYPNWPATQEWFHQVHRETGGANSPAMLDFEAVLGTIDRIGERYGRFQSDGECRDLEADLLRFEDRNNGRVLISTFYKAALGGMWQFQESVDHLRQLGALDESTAQASVIIPNYIGGVSNCLAASSYYKVCCTDQCEGLLGHIEDKIASSYGDAGQILSLIRALPSATTIAPRDLPSALIQRLNEIAASNGGKVPIHGRLFAQWMHHAYPRECPYPHVAGTISPRSSTEWRLHTGQSPSFSKSQMVDHVLEVEKSIESKNPAAAQVDEALPWTDGEELLIIPHSSPQRSSIVSRAFVRNIVLGMTLCSLVYAMLRPAMSAAGILKGHQTEKSYV